ncbi:hypothetical protein [Coralloluteibacterium stylophorae]|uniref:Uncharacterized protein n=1 Tax=Coralloluteibacterium stylophorae TaxID=1776034 RepID=A0A8J7VSI0_9GAMM|nr:hypothetical protein [Coralloluteibacterium stylophorae]MBS7457026.1 hypothetical protein [Coralloluteibacterium stylophorae]
MSTLVQSSTPVPASPANGGSRLVWWLLGGLLAVGLLVVLAIGGLLSWAWGAYREQAQAALQAEPAVAEQIGTIQDMSLDLVATGDAPGSELVFEVRGDRGAGTVTADFETVDADHERVASGSLVLTDGSRFELGEVDADAAWSDGDAPLDFRAQAEAAMAADPAIAAELGRILSSEMDEDASMAHPGADVFVFDLVGERGRGRVVAPFITVDAYSEWLGEGTLTLEDGRELEVGSPYPDAQARTGSGLDIDALYAEGMRMFQEQAQAALQADAAVAEHIGEIMVLEMDADATEAAPGEDTFVFDIAGSRGSGRVVADFITIDADTEQLGPGTLRLDDGRAIRLPSSTRL